VVGVTTRDMEVKPLLPEAKGIGKFFELFTSQSGFSECCCSANFWNGNGCYHSLYFFGI